MMSLYTALEKDEFVTGSKGWKSRLDARQKQIAAAEKDRDDDDEEETEEQRFKRETVELQSELQKTERATAAAQDKRERDRAKCYSQRITGGQFLKQPKAVTLVATTKKKKKSMKMGDIASAEEEDEPDTIPEGFHLQEESLHCVNMERSEDFQAYLRQVVAEFECLLKLGAKNIEEAYGQVVESFYWACRANKNTIIEDADRDEILRVIKDPTCRAWKMKLLGRKTLDPTSIIQEEPIGPQTASEIVLMNPEEMFQMLEEELETKTPEEVQQIKNTIKNLCKSQVLAHRHAANSADYLAQLTDMVSLPATIKVMNLTLRPVVAVKIPEVDDMLERA